jgi:hypothetical protein
VIYYGGLLWYQTATSNPNGACTVDGKVVKKQGYIMYEGVLPHFYLSVEK